MKFYEKTVELGQDAFDLCVQEYGDIRLYGLLLDDNPTVDFNAPLSPGQKLLFQITPIKEAGGNIANLEYYRSKAQRVNTQERPEYSELALTGIGYDSGSNQLRIETQDVLAVKQAFVFVDRAEIPEGQKNITNNLTFTRIDAYPSPALVSGNSYDITIIIGYKKIIQNIIV